MNNYEIKVKSLYKALTVFDLFNDEQQELSVTEIAEKTNFLKSSVHNILSTFAYCDFVEKNPKTNKYRLGKKILQLYHIYNKSNLSLNILKSKMNELSQKIGETVYLAVFNGENILYLHSAVPAKSLSAGNVQGVTAPMHCTGLGKAILSLCNDDVVQTIANGPLPPFTENTITDRETLLQEIKTTKERGYAVDNMEHEYGIKCVSIAFKSDEGSIYGISVSGPSLRFPNEVIEKYAHELKNLLV